MFEFNRLELEYLADAYQIIIPIVGRQTGKQTNESRQDQQSQILLARRRA